MDANFKGSVLFITLFLLLPRPGMSASNPIGFHDGADCTRTWGWACDAEDDSTPLTVEFYADGPAGSGGKLVGAVTANLTRDLGSYCGGKTNHGFSFSTPDSLKDGKPHTLYAYAIKGGSQRIPGANPLLGTPTTITCSAPPTLGPTDSGLIAIMKSNGCTWSGLLTESWDWDESVAMLGRSKCKYLFRSAETWLTPPNFELIRSNISKIKAATGNDYIYSMMIAEAIDIKDVYYNPRAGRNFDFNAMCGAGTYGKWGPNTCVPSMASTEYRAYLAYMTEKAIDAGIQDFYIGQVDIQDSWSSPVAPQIINEIKNYALATGKRVVIGGQIDSGEIAPTSYAQYFDYVAALIGQNADGTLQAGPCFSQFNDWCANVLWNPLYQPWNKNIFVYLDWASDDDDVHRFAKMSASARAQFIRDSYAFLRSKNVGFLLPFVASLGSTSQQPGCYGPYWWSYSASNRYSCADENVLNEVMTVPPKRRAVRR